MAEGRHPWNVSGNTERRVEPVGQATAPQAIQLNLGAPATLCHQSRFEHVRSHDWLRGLCEVCHPWQNEQAAFRCTPREDRPPPGARRRRKRTARRLQSPQRWIRDTTCGEGTPQQVTSQAERTDNSDSRDTLILRSCDCSCKSEIQDNIHAWCPTCC